MLDLGAVDLSSLCDALEDHSDETTWWFDPRTGEVEPHGTSSLDDDDLAGDPQERGLVWVEPVPSGEAYRDLEDFVARVRDPRAHDLLERAIAGRGAFRRFKDTLFDFPTLREAWFSFHDRRMECRAIDWLLEHALIDGAAGEAALAARSDVDSPELGGPLDVEAIVSSVAGELRALYGSRLRRVGLFGSWARGEATPESDIDLLVVLDDMVSPWDELRAMEPILWQHSLEHDTVVTAVPITDRELADPRSPALQRARDEARRVA
jgi:predicted nucleotidyltransferase